MVGEEVSQRCGVDPVGTGSANNSQTVLAELELVRNPKTGKGWVYNITDDKWERAINPIFSKRGIMVKGTYCLAEGKYYLHKYDDSSWKNTWEKFVILTVQRGEIQKIAQFKRLNGTYEFETEELKQHFINYSISLNHTADSPDKAVTVNVLEFAKYLIREGKIKC
ncbi:MAG: hypothetical protein QXQ37_06615 [Nitrososphaerota archaeon]